MQELIPLLEAHPLAFRAVALAAWIVATVRDSRRLSFWPTMWAVVACVLVFAPIWFAAATVFGVVLDEVLATLKARAECGR